VLCGARHDLSRRLTVCAMLQTLFTYENVRFGIHPVSGYSDLQEKFEKHMAEQPV
jgi:hypothetical protein